MTFLSGQLWRSINLQSIKVYYCFTTVYKEWKDQRKDQLNNQGVTIHSTISETGIMLFTLKIMLEVQHGKILTTLTWSKCILSKIISLSQTQPFVQLPPLIKQNQGSRKVPSGSPGLINLGNRTEWSPIRLVIIRVIDKIGQLVR